MKLRLLLPLVALSIGLLAGCKDADNLDKADFQLSFQPRYDGQALETSKDYNYGSFPVQFSRFNLYLSDITLLKGTEEYKLSEVEFVDFTPADATTNLAKTVVFNYPAAVPPGTYTGIRLGFGLKPDLNAKKPADFQPGTPLYNEDNYWPGWQSYIFSKVEGYAYPNGPGTDVLDLTYHCGGNQCYKAFTFNHDVVVTDTDGGQLTVDLDLKKLFTFDGQLFDIQTTPSSMHGSNGVALMEVLMGNFGNAVGLQ